MEKDIEKIFLNSKVKCPEELEQKVLFGIKEAKIKKAKMTFGIFAAAAASFGVFFVSIFSIILSNFTSSAFYKYASIIVSDSGVALTNWKQFSLVLLESAPIFDMFIAFTMLGVLLLLVSKAIREAGDFSKAKLIYK